VNFKRVFTYKFQSLFFKNMGINLVLLAFPFFIFIIIIISYNLKIIKEQISELTLNSLNRNIDLIDNLIDELKYTSVVFENTSSEIGFFEINNTNTNNEYFTFIYDTLRPFIFSNHDISSIYIYSEVKQTILNLDRPFEISSFPDTEWIEASRNRMLSTPYIILRKPYRHFSETISIVKPVMDNNTGEYFGAIIIDTKINEIMIKDERLLSELSITDENNTIIYSDILADIGKDLFMMDNSVEYMQLMRGDGKFLYNDDLHYILLTNHSRKLDLQYFYKVPLTTFDNRYLQLYRILAISIVILLILVIIASVLISLNSYRPIDNLLKIIEEPKSSNLSFTKTKEIEEIASNIISSMNTNKNLKEKMLDQIYLLDKTRMIALQAQINPHFLYNTLDAIRWKSMSLTNGENEVSSMIGILANLLRLSLEGDDNTTTLKDELEHAVLFLKILNSRYEDMFDFEMNIEKGLEECLVLKLCLQPLLENACYHGIKPTRNHGSIKLTGKTVNRKLIITIADNGTGIKDTEALRKEINKKVSFNDHHIGLRNVNQRIKLIFGEEYGLKITSSVNEGTSINLIFPHMSDCTDYFL